MQIPPGQGSIRRGGGGVWDPKVCVPKIADQIFPMGNFVFSRGGHFGLDGGEGGPGGGTPPPPPAVCGRSNTSLPPAPSPPPREENFQGFFWGGAKIRRGKF